MYWVNEKFAHRIINIANNLGQLSQDKYGGKVFLVNYLHLPLKKISPEELLKEIEALRPEIEDLDNYQRQYLHGKLESFEYFLRYLMGENFEYAVLLDKIEQLPCEEIGEEEIESLEKKSVDFLHSLGYKGSLGSMKEKWYSCCFLNSDEIIDYAERLIVPLKNESVKKVVKLHSDDDLDNIQGITGVYWSGFSAYTGEYKGNLTFNTDKKWNKYEFIHVMAHEAYPGHQAFYSRWDYLIRNDKFPLEAAYYLLNEPVNTLFEGGPENALSFLGWYDDQVNKFLSKEEVWFLNGTRLLMTLTRIYQTNAGYYYNTGKMNKDESIRFMIGEGHLNELDAENTFRFFSSKLSRITYPSYYYGRKKIEEAFNSIPKEKISDFFTILYDHPHTNLTFENEIKDLRES